MKSPYLSVFGEKYKELRITSNQNIVFLKGYINLQDLVGKPFAINQCLNVSWHLCNQPVALPESYGSPDFLDTCCQLSFLLMWWPSY